MLHISQLKLRGFKSFKYQNIDFPQNFVCFAGPNGSGKSNLCDSIRFVVGEKSFKSLRVKNIRELIHAGSKSAEVTMVLEGKGQKYEIKRAIRTDGKIQYNLNGKKTTRSAISEVLKQHNLDESGRNIIAQGRVQRIVEMTGRERRGIIESVAGISDFDRKKKEAIKELDEVGSRLREANILFGERSSRLKELEKEREIALKYQENKEKLKTHKYSLLTSELKKLEEELTSIIAQKSKLKTELEKRTDELKVINNEIYKIDQERYKLSSKLKEKQSTIEGIQHIEKLKASIQLKRKLLDDRTGQVKKQEEQKTTLEKQTKQETHEIESILKESSNLKEELKKFAPEDLEFKDDDSLKSIKSQIESEQSILSKSKEQLSLLDSKINTQKEIIKIKKEHFSEIS